MRASNAVRRGRHESNAVLFGAGEPCWRARMRRVPDSRARRRQAGDETMLMPKAVAGHVDATVSRASPHLEGDTARGHVANLALAHALQLSGRRDYRIPRASARDSRCCRFIPGSAGAGRDAWSAVRQREMRRMGRQTRSSRAYGVRRSASFHACTHRRPTRYPQASTSSRSGGCHDPIVPAMLTCGGLLQLFVPRVPVSSRGQDTCLIPYGVDSPYGYFFVVLLQSATFRDSWPFGVAVFAPGKALRGGRQPRTWTCYTSGL